MKRIFCLILLLITALSLSACGKPSEGMEMTDAGNTRLLLIRLEGDQIPEATVRVFPAEKGTDGERILGKALIPAFDGTDTHLLTLPEGGNYVLEVTNAQAETTRCFIRLKSESVYSFLMNLNHKEESAVRPLWPQTPHSRPEPY